VKRFGGFKTSLSLASVVILFLFWLIYIQKPEPGTILPPWVLYLPLSNAFCNALSAAFLIAAVRAVKKGMKDRHERLIYVALFWSALFLVGYITFYSLHGDRKFEGSGGIRAVYFFVLITHILGSIVSLPMILYTLSLSLQKLWPQHRVWARRTFPLWLYVSLTGVLVHVLFSLFST
jgi:putative membrane protein